MTRTVTAAEVRQTLRGLMAAYPKGTRFGPASVTIKNGEIHASVTPLEDSVHALSEEGRHEARDRIRRGARAAGGA